MLKSHRPELQRGFAHHPGLHPLLLQEDADAWLAPAPVFTQLRRGSAQCADSSLRRLLVPCPSRVRPELGLADLIKLAIPAAAGPTGLAADYLANGKVNI
jgi:hypothetical protein